MFLEGTMDSIIIFEKYTYNKCNENHFYWEQICPIRTDGRADKKLIFFLMFFWPCIMNWLYINYQLDALIIIYS